MACGGTQSNSSALVTRKYDYDVFVSFRGEDTCNNFTDHLFGAFQRKGIFAFRDDKNLKKGESIAPELLRAIEGSHVYVVVFSKNYASSTWCLRELEKILEYAQSSEKRVLPIFVDVNPSDVRNQNGSYEEAFAKHDQERFKQDPGMVQRWKTALRQVANLSGWDLRDKPQHEEIERIVDEIVNKLSHKFPCLPKDLVGIDSRLEELEKLLVLDSVDHVRVVGICGMSGIGKTTLAHALYDRISCQFGACCFIDDVSKIYRHDGPIGAQKQILHQTLRGEHLQICNLYNTTSLIRSRLYQVKTLIILDNVDQAEQLEKLMYIPREKFLRILSFLHKTPWGLYDVDMEYTFIELQGSHVMATNTGYRWVLKEDLQQMHCRNSLARKCEFLAIEFEDKAEEQPQPESFI